LNCMMDRAVEAFPFDFIWRSLRLCAVGLLVIFVHLAQPSKLPSRAVQS
jgi:hypothetical protein